jgi:hypothetical protein
MSIAYPAVLPIPLRNNFSLQTGNQILITEFESGAPRVRRKNSLAAETFSATWHLSNQQQSIFKAWWQQRGFGETVEMPLRSHGGEVATHFVVMKDPPRYQQKGPAFWSASATLMIVQPQMLSADELYALVDVGLNFEQLVASLYQRVNIDLPIWLHPEIHTVATNSKGTDDFGNSVDLLRTRVNTTYPA